jgi:hypothetical protein
MQIGRILRALIDVRTGTPNETNDAAAARDRNDDPFVDIELSTERQHFAPTEFTFGIIE